jgi:hypothetical protein
MRDALTDPNLLGTMLSDDSWSAWRILLIAAMGEALHDDERQLFTKLTGREREPLQRVEEFIGIVGRRGGKSRAVSVLAAYLAGLCNHRKTLVPGERGVVLCIAPDQRQAHITLDYARAAFEVSPLMRQLIAHQTADTLSLTTGIDIEVRASSFRRLRGPTFVAVIADESAFFMTDDASSNPDSAILNAVRPGLSTTRGMMAIISSPYAKRGELWTSFKSNYGPNGDPLILVAQGSSRDFNPSLPQSVVDRALERDRPAASAEYLALFRDDIEGFISTEVAEAAVVPGRYELAHIDGVNYIGFCDPSGGGSDSMTMAVSHVEGDRIILDCIRERRPPFSPDDVTREFSETFKSYSITTVKGDRYAGSWPAKRFLAHGIEYRTAIPVKSDLYLALLPLLNSGRVELPDHPRLVGQLCALGRRTARSGKDSIDHAPNSRDDLINAACGAIVLAAQRPMQIIPHVAPIILSLLEPIGPGSRSSTELFYEWASTHRYLT